MSYLSSPRLVGGIGELSGEPHDDEDKPIAGIAIGVVLATPCWAIIGWIIYSVVT